MGTRPLRRRRFLTVLGGGGLAGAVLAACGGDSEPSSSATQAPGGTQGQAGVATIGVPSGAQPRRGGTLTINGTNFSKLEAVTGTGGNDHQYLWAVFDNLVSYAKDFAPDPKRSGAGVENPDPLTWIFKPARCEVHDGTLNAGRSRRTSSTYRPQRPLQHP
jgi:hypothetical protein